HRGAADRHVPLPRAAADRRAPRVAFRLESDLLLRVSGARVAPATGRAARARAGPARFRRLHIWRSDWCRATAWPRQAGVAAPGLPGPNRSQANLPSGYFRGALG